MSKYDENHRHTNPTSAMNLKHMEKTTLRYIIIKLLKIKNKQKILKAVREKRHVTYSGTKIKMTADSYRKQHKQEDSGATSLKYFKKKLSTWL